MELPLHYEDGKITIPLNRVREIAQIFDTLNGIAMTNDGHLVYVDQSKNTVIRMDMNHRQLQLIQFHKLAWIVSFLVSRRAHRNVLRLDLDSRSLSNCWMYGL